MTSNTTSSAEPYPGIPYGVFYSIRLLMGVFSILGNALLMAAIIRFKNLRTSANVILFSLAVADFCTTLTGPVSLAVTFLQGKFLFHR